MGVSLRELQREECGLIAHIDRAETIDAQYVLVDGALELRTCDIEVEGWYPEELEDAVPRLVALLDEGGMVLGAWDGDAFVGLASLDTRPVGDDMAIAKMDMLYISRSHRGRGIGGQLTSTLSHHARQHSATSLYISATPTRNTVDAYLAMGAVVAVTPDPALFALEPYDIHLILPI
jgi:GNAT superfamily N-acetyltransferase